MFDSNLQSRFARSYSDAAFGYARAATAAYAAVADQTLEFWTNAARSPETGFRRPAEAASPFDMWPSPAREFFKSAASPWSNAGWNGSPQNAFAQRMAMAPVTAWWGMFPLQGNPSSWPMAYALMSAGMPRSVALPTAEANTAALEAAEAATEQINDVFATYRSESGYAVAQIISPRKLMVAFFMAPLGAAASFPWLMPTSTPGF
jgi:hypothetical protein